MRACLVVVPIKGVRPKEHKAPTSSETTGARDGNRTHDPSLTKTVRYRCATRASFRWAVRDSNPRSRQTADLQSAPFGHFGNCPGKSPPIHQHFLIDRLGYYSRRFVSCQAFNSEAVEETGCF